jgi:hypothetical protein
MRPRQDFEPATPLYLRLWPYRLWTEECEWDDGDSILAAVGELAGCDDDAVGKSVAHRAV